MPVSRITRKLVLGETYICREGGQSKLLRFRLNRRTLEGKEVRGPRNRPSTALRDKRSRNNECLIGSPGRPACVVEDLFVMINSQILVLSLVGPLILQS